ncbi:ATP-dependent DNA helicase [Cellulomonas sp. ES6]|uniref:ATP-dependent DNA helicase n=1 Tax=Cellulomonas sp. ES6 TaxID=3039384 RepID=UPI0024B86F39|nr:ATP-dependent DNA helicase [Cellulomonas sp. ES6]WHP17529.1 ATP-dependent DNA helicase [Cellulomonas sp. ES6]
MPDPAPDVDHLLDVAVAALGGAPREGQRRMAREVADAIEAGRHVMVQAGTGTGKSLGYLVPSVRHAVLADERVVVSTATLALQRQVMTRDLPLVADALAPELPRPPQVALLKGWHNYVCVHKTAGGYPPDDQGMLFDLGDRGAADHPATAEATDGEPAEKESLGAQVVRLREWAEATETGDRDDLVPGVGDRAWRQVSVTALECLGQRCPVLDECFPERARAAARSADVVVTNHAMLGIAASGSPGVLPEHQVLVVDEAHELADRVTAQSTAELSVATVEHAGRIARRHAGVATTDLDGAAAALGTALMQLPEGRFAQGLPEGTRATVAMVRDAARSLLTALRPEKPAAGESAQPDPGLKIATSAVLALFEVAERMAADPDDQRFTVLWCSRGERDGATRLYAAPLAVNGLIRTNLLAGRASVLTSATLSLGGEFRPMARAIGLEGAGEAAAATASVATPAAVLGAPGGSEGTDAGGAASAGEASARGRAGAEGTGSSATATLPWHGVDVGSPFDYPRQGILYIARRLPPPGREPATDAQLDEIEALVTAAGGRTLGLFSSRRAAVAVGEAMRERLDVPVLVQGEDQLPTLVRRFAEDEATCLFGTLSLWQGVDVPGRANQLVIIDRIPFPRPDDPVRSARSEAVAAAGGNGFMSVAATHAALLLAQGAGRLIRSVDDRGVVAVLDPRLATARYGEFLARSLPAFWRTTDREVALGALRRLAQP